MISFRILFGFCIAIIAIGCATAPDPDPPDLSRAEQATETRLASLDAATQSILNDLSDLEDIQQDLRAMTALSSASEIPLSILRLVAMNCLNTEYQGTLSEFVGLDGTPLTCRPTHIELLSEALDEAPTTVREQTLELLYLVDRARILRGTLRQRFSRLPRTLSEHRNFIADQRAMLRRLEADLTRQRNLYSTAGWRASQIRIDDHREILETLRERLDEIAEAYPEWPARLDALISTIYFDLSDMRAPRPRGH